MLKIQKSSNGEVTFTVGGRVNAEYVDELKTLRKSAAAARRIVLDLKGLTLVDHDAVSFLKSCEAEGIELKNCPSLHPRVDHEGTTRKLALKQRLGTSS
jgi:anti-anti-sigma regulatory factor